MSRRRLRLVAGFLAAGGVIALFLWAVGPEKVLDRLSQTDPVVFSTGFLAVAAALWCWSEALARLLAGVGHPAGGLRFRGAYLSVEFIKKILPMGQMAAPIFLAYVVSQETDTPYETTLAATSLLSLVNIATSLLLAVISLAVLVVTGYDLSGPLFLGLLFVLAMSVAGLVGIGALVHFRRPLLERAARRFAAAVRRTLGRLSVRVQAALAPDRVEAVVEDLSAAVDSVLGNVRAVALAVVFSVVAWALFLIPIYTGLLALDADPHVPYALVTFVVPVVMMVNIVPLPGGFGGFDVAVAAILSILGGVTVATAAAALFLYRLSNYWFVLLLGGSASLALSLGLEEPPEVIPPEDEAIEIVDAYDEDLA